MGWNITPPKSMDAWTSISYMVMTSLTCYPFYTRSCTSAQPSLSSTSRQQLSSGANFTNVLCASFTLVDPKSVKRHWQLDWILALLGAMGVKAACKHVGEIDPRCQFHQHFVSSCCCCIIVFCKAFLYSQFKCKSCS